MTQTTGGPRLPDNWREVMALAVARGKGEAISIVMKEFRIDRVGARIFVEAEIHRQRLVGGINT